jgi:hypothetical protein
MTTSSEVLNFLCPGVEWAMTDDDFDTVIWINVNEAPITKSEFKAGFAKYENSKKAEAEAKAAARQAILDRIGLTADEAKLLLG